MVETLLRISATTFKDEGRALRSVHAKGHVLLRAELSALPDLAPELAQGQFATAAQYPVLMRISTSPGDVLDDGVSTPRGVAIKVLGVSGER